MGDDFLGNLDLIFNNILAIAQANRPTDVKSVMTSAEELTKLCLGTQSHPKEEVWEIYHWFLHELFRCDGLFPQEETPSISPVESTDFVPTQIPDVFIQELGLEEGENEAGG